MQFKTCAFTGHRFKALPFHANESAPSCIALRAALIGLIETLIIKENVKHFICGMALGVDQICAEIVLDLKRDFPDVTLCCFIPCRTQFERWTPAQTARYRAILSKADEVRYLQEHYTKDCMIRRNHAMVDSSDLLLAVWNGSVGGTSSTVNYAKKKRIPIIVLHPETLQQTSFFD